MSEPIRIALVAEGPTDGIVISAAIGNILGSEPFVLKQLQPEESLVFGQLHGGWGGVYHWCRQAVLRAGGAIHNDPLFASYDVLVVHLDADVAEAQYAEAGITDPINDLPCMRVCPPARDTTDQLRLILTRWVGGPPLPEALVWCTPSKCTEAWVLAALYPTDSVVTSGSIECYATPNLRLQSKPKTGRLITGGRKITEMYRDRATEISQAWAEVRGRCGEADRFSNDFEALI